MAELNKFNNRRILKPTSDHQQQSCQQLKINWLALFSTSRDGEPKQVHEYLTPNALNPGEAHVLRTSENRRRFCILSTPPADTRCLLCSTTARPPHPQFASPQERVKERLASPPADPEVTPEEGSRPARMLERLRGSGCPPR